MENMGHISIECGDNGIIMVNHGEYMAMIWLIMVNNGNIWVFP